MSDCLHCDIHEMLASRLQGEQVDLAEIAAQVTEVLADLILLAPPDERTALMADVLATSGGWCWRRAKGQTRPICAVRAIDGRRRTLEGP
jgi:hypothetical protein